MASACVRRVITRRPAQPLSRARAGRPSLSGGAWTLFSSFRHAAPSTPPTGRAGTPLPGFGAAGGPCIQNKSTILQDVDRAICPSDPRPPDIEVLLTNHLAYVGNPLSKAVHRHLIALGHVLVRYTTSDGEQRVMNILGGHALDEPGEQMVNFAPPSEYLYGTAGFGRWSQQGGAYNRDIVGVRIERAPDGVVDALHAYYVALQQRSRISTEPASLASKAAARFQLFGGRLTNFAANHLPQEVSHFLTRETRLYAAAGNCAQWTSAGLQWVGLVRRPRLVPKAILIELLEREHRIAPDNVHVVVYKHVRHAETFYKGYEPTLCTFVHPLYALRNRVYADMDAFADVLVRVPEGTDEAVVERQPPEARLRPPTYLPWLNGVWFGVSAAALLGFFDGPEPVQHLSAGGIAMAWLVLNYLFY